MNKNDIKNKKDIITLNHKDDKKTKKLPFKIFLDENKSNKKKLHIFKSNKLYLKDSQFEWKNCENNKFNNNNLNLLLFSNKILEAKHNSTPELYFNQIYKILIKKRKCHFLAYFNEMAICTSTLRDYLKRYYTYEETKERIPKYVSYYKNYLLYFCRPFFTNYLINKKMVKYMEKIAQIFYNENYDDEKKEKKYENNNNEEGKIQIFSKKISQEIENCDAFTIVNSESVATKRSQKKNNKVKNNKINNINPLEIEQSTIIGSSNLISNLYTNEGQQIKSQKKKMTYKNNEMINSQNKNSICEIINELENNQNNDYIKKINNIGKISNENKKMNKNADIINNPNHNCIIIRDGKTTNNINININYLTIGKKLLSPKENSKNIIKKFGSFNYNIIKNDNNKIITKLKSRDNDNNLFINIKHNPNNNKINNYMENDAKKNNSIKDKNKKKSSALTLPPPAQNKLSIINKKFIKLSPNTINNYHQLNNISKNPLKETRNKSVFRGGYNIGSISIKNIFNVSKNQSKFGKTMNTNNTNHLKNIINNMGTIKIKKNNCKNFERENGRSSSNIDKRPKKVFNSILKFNSGNIQMFSFKNNNNLSENINIISPISKKKNNDKFHLFVKKEPIYKKINGRDLKKKERHLSLNKFLNITHSRKRVKSTGQ